MVQFSVQKIAEIMVQGMMKFIILVKHDFLLAYMGVFWSEATPVFSIKSCHMTRVLKTVSGRNFAHFQQISSGRKMQNFIFFPLAGNSGPLLPWPHREMERSPEQNKIFLK